MRFEGKLAIGIILQIFLGPLLYNMSMDNVKEVIPIYNMNGTIYLISNEYKTIIVNYLLYYLSFLITFFICIFLTISFFMESKKFTKTYIQQTIIFSTLMFVSFYLTSWFLQIIIPCVTFVIIDKYSWRKNIKKETKNVESKPIKNQPVKIIVCWNCKKQYFSYRDKCPYCNTFNKEGEL